MPQARKAQTKTAAIQERPYINVHVPIKAVFNNDMYVNYINLQNVYIIPY